MDDQLLLKGPIAYAWLGSRDFGIASLNLERLDEFNKKYIKMVNLKTRECDRQKWSWRRFECMLSSFRTAVYAYNASVGRWWWRRVELYSTEEMTSLVWRTEPSSMVWRQQSAVGVYGHFGIKTLRHRCRSVRRTFRHRCRSVSDTSAPVPKYLGAGSVRDISAPI